MELAIGMPSTVPEPLTPMGDPVVSQMERGQENGL